jgi:translation elongation factor EF-1alpha
MTKDCIRRNSRKETRSYYTILDTRSSTKENYKANGMDRTSYIQCHHRAVTIMDAKGDQYVVNGQ